MTSNREISHKALVIRIGVNKLSVRNSYGSEVGEFIELGAVIDVVLRKQGDHLISMQIDTFASPNNSVLSFDPKISIDEICLNDIELVMPTDACGNHQTVLYSKLKLKRITHTQEEYTSRTVYLLESSNSSPVYYDDPNWGY